MPEEKEEKKQDETVVGGRYQTPAGQWVDAEGKPLESKPLEDKAVAETETLDAPIELSELRKKEIADKK